MTLTWRFVCTILMAQSSLTVSEPLCGPTQRVIKDWIDYNGHLNLAYYHVIFDRGVDYVFDLLGVGQTYTEKNLGSCFALEVHVHYLQELSLDDELDVHFQLLDFDEKRLHFIQHLYHRDEGFLAATSEQMTLHVNMQSRRAAPFPEEAIEKIHSLHQAHAKLKVPDQVGHVIGIRRK